jgi:hypothetical protein
MPGAWDSSFGTSGLETSRDELVPAERAYAELDALLQQLWAAVGEAALTSRPHVARALLTPRAWTLEREHQFRATRMTQARHITAGAEIWRQTSRW